MARGEKEEETDEDELSPMAESPKQAELEMGIANKVKIKMETADKAEAEMGTKDMVDDVGPKEPVDPMVSQEDIAKD